MNRRLPTVFPIHRRAGMALVVVLALIVLMTAVVLAFFVRATANRVVEESRANRIGVEQLAQTARDYVAAGFLFEIAAKSVSSTNTGIIIRQPISNLYAIPQRPLPASLIANTNFANLLRRSINESTNGVGETNASSHAASDAARNGRSVGTSRWNAPLLLSGGGFSDTNQLPHWIYVTEDGAVTSTPGTDVVGRFAYVVYDTGGLLDVNVAGHPDGIAGNSLAILKGSLAGADLSVVPGVTDVEAFMRWRNPQSGGSPDSYVTAVTNAATNGFLQADSGDQRITSRQDLINLARQGTFGITTNALPFFTHVSRAANAPSWTPRQNASAMKDYGGALAITPRNYRDDAEKPTSVNRNIPNVRVSKTFVRRDGTTARIGEPLIKERFPLEKLALVRDGAEDPGILSYFGLTWNKAAAGWNYRSDTIATLGQVADDGREPDFFELLKAGVLDGSLGKSTADNSGVQNIGPNAADPSVRTRDRNLDLQIFAIGANLIDQADADSSPTTILRSDSIEDVFGMENHPSIYLISQTPFRRHDMDYNPSNTDNPAPWVTCYQQFQVWNPNRNAAANTGRTYRIRALAGESRVEVLQLGATSAENEWLSSVPVNQTGRFISFTDAGGFSEPVLLTPDTISGASPENTHVVLGASLAGFHLGDVRADNNGDNNPSNDYDRTIVTFGTPVIYQLEYSDGGVWKPIQRIPQLNKGMPVGMKNPSEPNLMPITSNIYSGKRDMMMVWGKSDPRSQRFGVHGIGGVGDHLNNTTTRAATNKYFNAWGQFFPTSSWKVSYPLPVFSFLNYPTLGYMPGDLADNRVNSGTTCVADPDGVVRPGDGTRATNILAAGSQARPVVLDRPFLNVGEMAFAMRGDPWRSVDFFSSGSADSALLDLFCVSSAPAIQAGKVNPNSASGEVLQALLAGAETDPGVSMNSLSGVPALAEQIRTCVGTNALETPADLARITETLTVSGTARDQPVLPGLDHKCQWEVLVRALAGISNTRTWNLMVDVVAQSGSFPPNSSAASAFVVKGELRVWTHLAIDRPTGEILSEHSEICPE